jgi:hypothetical protein
VSTVPGATVQSVDYTSTAFNIHVTTPGDLPPVDTLIQDLQGQVPNGSPIVVISSVGQQIDAGTVGQ